jgi:hypothetical protein
MSEPPIQMIQERINSIKKELDMWENHPVYLSTIDNETKTDRQSITFPISKDQLLSNLYAIERHIRMHYVSRPIQESLNVWELTLNLIEMVEDKKESITVGDVRHTFKSIPNDMPLNLVCRGKIKSRSFPDDINDSTEDSEIEKSKKWLENYMNELYESCPRKEFKEINLLIKAAEEWINDGERFDVWDYDFPLHGDFWHHYEIYTGKKVDESKTRNFFICSC